MTIIDIIRVVPILITLILGCSTPVEQAPPNMVHIPSGVFKMGARSGQAYQDEYPRHKVQVSSFYMDKYEVTNKEFKKFVEQTGYKTVAERDIDWEKMKKEVSPGTPKPPDSLLKAGSLVFKSTLEPVNLNDYSQW